ncbi:SDR family oxidoreductase [Xanthomonas sp. AM6]|uniref:SDR family oxidoreductase n=1 Tax=Xanthomonas sp. AM6 TaxID=2982531 RepID=UPI0021D8536C|nr:SDR family oxidoreductase [Xanthomonas sp. AM6]UYB54279.1 SDR family oxidoreductase [Xanthomonas sp. AM6]
MDLKDKIALVTGASSGIGAATALKLAANGVKVGLAARRVDRLQALVDQIKSAGGEAIAIEMDVVDAASVQAGVKRLADAYGSIDILFNNAGLMPISDVESLKTDEWHRMVDVNIKGLLNSTAAVLPYMQKQRQGHIFNTSSIAGRKVFPGLSVYCATKHAVTAFSEGLRLEVAKKYNIRVTCIQPGAVDTELFEHVSDKGYREQMEGLREQMAFLKASDIADTILFALQAPDYVNVAELFVLPTDQPW